MKEILDRKMYSSYFVKLLLILGIFWRLLFSLSISLTLPKININISVAPNVSSHVTQMTTVWIALHAIKGRLGNFMMQYSSAWGIAATLASQDDNGLIMIHTTENSTASPRNFSIQWCLTKETYRKRRNIIHPIAGPWASSCPEEQWTKIVVNEWYERNETYDPSYLQYLRNQKFWIKTTNVQDQNTPIFNKSKAVVLVVRMVGFWSSFRYFDTIRARLRQFWKLSNPISLVTYLKDPWIHPLSNSSLLLHGSNVTFVGIHIRRGDMKSVSAYRIPRLSYYNRAMMYYDEQYSHQVHFVVSTDDIYWWKRQHKLMSRFPHRISLLPSTLEPILAWSLLVQCHHMITSIGTFGWWAAYLLQPPNETRASNVVYPLESYDTPYWTPERRRNFIPSDWKGL
jgi:hypothetical protein